jgi:hypothetical protein
VIDIADIDAAAAFKLVALGRFRPMTRSEAQGFQGASPDALIYVPEDEAFVALLSEGVLSILNEDGEEKTFSLAYSGSR